MTLQNEKIIWRVLVGEEDSSDESGEDSEGEEALGNGASEDQDGDGSKGGSKGKKRAGGGTSTALTAYRNRGRRSNRGAEEVSGCKQSTKMLVWLL